MASRSVRRRLRYLATAALGAGLSAAGLASMLRAERPRALGQEPIQKILVIRLDLLGDLALSMPAVQAIRRRYPASQLDLLVQPYTAPLVPCYGLVDHVFTFDVNALRPSGDMLNWSRYRELWDLVGRLRVEQYDLVVSLHGLWASALAFWSGARFRVGYRGESFGYTLNLPVPGRRYRQRQHELEYCLELARAVGASDTEPHPRPLVSAEAAAAAAALLAPISAENGPIVAIHVGATNGGAKRWPTAGWAEVARRLMEERSLPVVFVGTERERALIDDILARMPGRPLVLAGQTPVPILLAVLERCALVLSGDSGPLHLAMALGVPTVAIHGPTDPALSGPYGTHARILRRDLPCSPCYDLRDVADCPLGDPVCMKGLSSDEVFQAAVEQLG